MKTKQALDALAALSQPHRLAVHRWLVERAPEGAFAGDIAAHLGVPAPTLSFHLKTLQAAGLVRAEPEGRHIRYHAALDTVQGLVAYLTENCCGGRRCGVEKP